MFLLLGAIVAVVIQKQHESANAIAVTMHHHNLPNANFGGLVSIVTVALAILSWGIAIWRHEKHRWELVAVIVLLLLYVLLKLIMV